MNGTESTTWQDEFDEMMNPMEGGFLSGHRIDVIKSFISRTIASALAAERERVKMRVILMKHVVRVNTTFEYQDAAYNRALSDVLAVLGEE